MPYTRASATVMVYGNVFVLSRSLKFGKHFFAMLSQMPFVVQSQCSKIDLLAHGVTLGVVHVEGRSGGETSQLVEKGINLRCEEEQGIGLLWQQGSKHLQHMNGGKLNFFLFSHD